MILKYYQVMFSVILKFLFILLKDKLARMRTSQSIMLNDNLGVGSIFFLYILKNKYLLMFLFFIF